MAVTPSSSLPPLELSPIYQIFKTHYAPSMEESSKRDDAKRLVATARAFFKGLNTPPKTPPTPVKCPIPKEVNDFVSLVKTVFDKGFSGLCIGEQKHTDVAPKKALIDAMPALKEMGVDTLYCEHIKSDMQEDEYPKFLRKLDIKYHLIFSLYSYTKVIKKAKEVGIRVVAIDSSISAVAGCHPDLLPDGDARVAAMNYTAQKIMNAEKEHGRLGKYIVLTGAHHGSEIVQMDGPEIKDSGVPGISELMQCPFVIVADTPPSKKPKIYHNPSTLDKFRYQNKEGTVHAVCFINKPTDGVDSPRRNIL